MNSVFELFNERLFYNEKTGAFYWRNTKLVSRSMKGKEAGTINDDGYRDIGFRIEGKTKHFKAHRLAWLFVNKCFPENHIDHINGDRLDNRIENLRIVTIAQNNQNIREPKKNNKIGVLGVCLDGGRYKAQITIQGKNINIGRFNTIEEASNAYMQEKRKHHEFCTI